jgi:hypothetical protein
MNRIAKTATTVTLAVTTVIAGLAAAIVIAFVAFAAITQPTSAPAATTVVQTADQTSSFNDGYATAMQDACQQGSAYACQWLHTN